MKLKFTITIVLPAFFSLTALAQREIRGKVIDDAGEDMIGVNILIQGSSTGTITDVNGSYVLDIPGDGTILVFSLVGYITQTVDVGTRSVVNLTLESDLKQLQEVVVTALGFKQQKDKMGATYSTVNTDDMVRSGEPMLLNSLATKAANVRISRTNGDPGAGSTIRIRGANTISGPSDPLIIVDGVPISGSTIYGTDIGGNELSGGETGGVSQQSRLNDINPNDIESVQILKGASAASLWGSRAANGVIVSTTKNGKAGKMKIDFKSTVSFDRVHERIPMQSVWGQGRNGEYSPTGIESWGDYIPARSGGPDEVDQSGEFFEAEDGTRYYPIITRNSQDTYVDSNWDQVFQTGYFIQNDLSISGGKEDATYFMSVGRLDQEGIIRRSDYDRTNLRLNTKFNLTDWITITSKAGYISTSSNRIQQNSNTAGLLLGLLRTPPDFDITDYLGTYHDGEGGVFRGRQRAYRRYLGSRSNPTYNNPLWTINEQISTSTVNRFNMSTELNISPADFLQIILRGGVDNYSDKQEYLFPIGTAGDNNPGAFAEDIISERELNFDAIARGNFRLSNEVALQATLGWNINDRNRRFNNATIIGFLVNSGKPTTDLNTAAQNSTVENQKRLIRSNRGFGILSFDLYDQLFVNLSGTMEAASSVTGTFFYPSIDAAWQFTKKFNLGNTFISFGKLRASWGQVGVQPIAHRFQTVAEGAFRYTTYDDPLDISLFGGGFRLDDDLGNPDLEPEIKTEWEIGLDLRLFSDKLSLNMSYYQNEIEDILFRLDLTPSFGYDTKYDNAGTMENKGFELETDYTIYNQNNWNIGLYANWSRNVNEVTRLKGTETINLSPGASVSSRAIVGEQLGVLFGTGSQVDENGNFILDANGFPQLTPSPIVLGDPNPDWRGGLGLRARWKNLALNVLFEHAQGGDFSPRTQWVLRRFGTTAETANRITLSQDLVNYDGVVIPAGTTVRGNVADFGGGPVLLDETWYRTGIGGGFGDNQAYNFSIIDATFTRLRELSLSYVINDQWFREKTKLSAVTLTATGRNLALWTDLVGVDPEVNQVGVGNALGLDYFTNPSTASFLFSIQITY